MSTVHSTTKCVFRQQRQVFLIHATQIGACRHGDRCSRKHIRPPFSQTILLPNVYHNPAHDPVCKLTEKELQEGFDAVYEDLYCELAKFGHLLELHVCDVCHVMILLSFLFFRSAITWEIILLVTFMRDTNGKPRHRLLLIIAMNAGTQVSPDLTHHGTAKY